MILSSIKFKLRLVLFIFSSNLVFAQSSSNRNVFINLSEVALIGVKPIGAITLYLNVPLDAGRPVGITANNTKWLNYTSALRADSPRRIVTAQIDQVIPGLNLKLQARPASGNGGGALGTSTGNIVLHTAPTTIISGIGGSFTGNGTNNGHQLLLSLDFNNYEELTQISNRIVTITYTISN